MKKEELMIGDWVLCTQNGKPEQVQEIGTGLVMLDYNDLYEYDEVEPIPLTAEILTQNKISKSRLMGEQRHFTYYLGPQLSLLAIYDADFSFHIGEGARKVRYVHELQHLMRICGVEKELVISEK